MKKYFVLLQILFGVLSFPYEIFSQLDMQNYIGKSQADLINLLGKPVYTDNSNKSMVMIFYKSSNSSISFVADENGIYQAEVTQSYDSEKSCQEALNTYISDVVKNGFSVDTISVSEFQSEKPGITCNFHSGLNTTSNKYEISVSAHRKDS